MILLLSLLVLNAGDAKLTITPDPVRISLERGGASIAAAHPASSLLLGDPDKPEPASVVGESYNSQGHRVLSVRTPSGLTATVTITLTPNQADLIVRPTAPSTVLLRFAPLSPGFGLADHAVTHRDSFDTDITGYRNDRFLSGTGLTRLISNFTFYPKQRFGFLVWDPGIKMVRSTSVECLQGVRNVTSEVRFSLFTGSPAEIYRQFLESRNMNGYPVMKPKYDFFGVGWEAFGALAWDTNYKTVAENVGQYLSLGFPLVYPDIVGGTFGEGHFDLKVTPRMRQYMKRNAMWAALHPSMSMGQGPWTFGDPEVEAVLLQAAQLHDRLQPYFYSQAVRFYLDGYPWSFTPLPVAFPNDPQVYGRENAKVRGYEWMIGDSLLAAPLYGNDYETATSRDVYLPAGTWMEYDSGKRHQGPVLLKDFVLPVRQTPLFVGGTGIVVEKKGDALVARIYPVTSHAETRFIHPDGNSVSNLRVQVADWKRATVKCSSGRTCTGTWQRHAFEFVIQPGEDYEIQ